MCVCVCVRTSVYVCACKGGRGRAERATAVAGGVRRRAAGHENDSKMPSRAVAMPCWPSGQCAIQDDWLLLLMATLECLMAKRERRHERSERNDQRTWYIL